MKQILSAFLIVGSLAAAEFNVVKGPMRGSVSSAPVLNRLTEPEADRNIAAISPDELPAFESDDDGNRYLLLRFKAEDAAAVRLRFSDFSLPEDARVYIYSVDGTGSAANVKGPYTASGPLHSNEFWSDPVPASEVVLELQIDTSDLAALPFDIVEMETLDAEALARFSIDTNEGGETFNMGEVSERGVSMYRGVEVEHEVRNGFAVLEGDMILGRVEELIPAGGGKSNRREGVSITSTSYRWPGGVVPYVIDAAVAQPQRIADATAHWNSKLGGLVRFVPRTSETSYIKFYKGFGGCFSYVGKMGTATGQPVLVDPACTTGNIIHELGHTLGLFHEHTREDRNSHVKINTANISAAHTSDFAQNIYNADDVGIYDYASIMHYGTHAWSKNGQPTITTIPAGIPIGQRTGLSAGDIATVTRMYSAPAPPPIGGPVGLTVASNPSKVKLTIDGFSIAAPIVMSWLKGSNHTVSAPDYSTSTARYRFISWSDGGARTHTVMGGVTSLTANFAASYSVKVTNPPAGTGTVTVTPASADSFQTAGSQVTLIASPGPSYCFAGWTGLASGTPAVTTLAVTKAYSVAAKFLTGGMTLTPAALNMNQGGGSASISVALTAGCLRKATSTETWIKVTAGASGTGSGVVQLSISPLSGATGTTRTGVVLVNGKSVTVVQQVQ
jgi:astacin